MPPLQIITHFTPVIFGPTGAPAWLGHLEFRRGAVDGAEGGEGKAEAGIQSWGRAQEEDRLAVILNLEKHLDKFDRIQIR